MIHAHIRTSLLTELSELLMERSFQSQRKTSLIQCSLSSNLVLMLWDSIWWTLLWLKDKILSLKTRVSRLWSRTFSYHGISLCDSLTKRLTGLKIRHKNPLSLTMIYLMRKIHLILQTLLTNGFLLECKTYWPLYMKSLAITDSIQCLRNSLLFCMIWATGMSTWTRADLKALCQLRTQRMLLMFWSMLSWTVSSPWLLMCLSLLSISTLTCRR